MTLKMAILVTILALLAGFPLGHGIAAVYTPSSQAFSRQARPDKRPTLRPHPDERTPRNEKPLYLSPTPTFTPAPGDFTIDRTLSDDIQLTTIVFDALAFITGNLGPDSFLPPGKMADFWGFQCLRDNDPSGAGDNPEFLTRAAYNMFGVLNSTQKASLIDLAKAQIPSIKDYAYRRFVLMIAFRRLLIAKLPPGTSGLDEAAVKTFSGELYRLDGEISYARARVMGTILNSLNGQQKGYLDGMVGRGMPSWPEASEPAELGPLNGAEKAAVTAYAGDLFAWYAGSIDADVYFCPGRQAAYFGAFYMKEAPALANAAYSLGPDMVATVESGFLTALNPTQAQAITGLVDTQHADLLAIVDTRRQIATHLRMFKSGSTANKDALLNLMKTYGELDGSIAYAYATNFVKIGRTLNDSQKATLFDLRHQYFGYYMPQAAFLYDQPVDFPLLLSTDFLFK